ncbi:MAG: NAD(+) synthase [Acidobacteria bacterium]|nr:NAD(+) synthase [Acidobacteriota bacterium]
MSLADRLSSWLAHQVDTAHAQGLVTGLSGGVDSAVVARLCQLATPAHCLGVIMPCHSDPRDEDDAQLLAAQFRIPVMRLDLGPPYDELIARVDTAFTHAPGLRPHATDDIRARMPLANIKPRLRMTALYAIANRLNYLVAGTGNRSELAIGYFTKYGDGGVDLLPLGRLVKREVLALARELEIPQSIVERTPTAGLWLGQTDEAEMGFTYDQLESYLAGGSGTVPDDVARRIGHLVTSSEHKRHLPPLPPA